MPEQTSIAVVVVPNGPEKELHYAIPGSLSRDLKIGLRLQVPLGSRSVIGYLVGFTDSTPARALREIQCVLEEVPSLPPALVRLAVWIAEYYQTTLARTLRLLIPSSIEKAKPRRQTLIRLTLPMEAIRREIVSLGRRAPRLQGLLSELVERRGEADLSVLPKQFRGSVSPLVAKGLIERVHRESFRDPFPQFRSQEIPMNPLTPAQEEAAGAIAAAICGERFAPFLLHGVTGSGKTEIYLRAADQTLQKGKGTIILVPEIGLTPQLLSRFRERFGDQVVLFHSGLSAGERWDAWRRVRGGGAKIALGTRSAVFAPLGPVGLIVVDEEHDPSYKQEEGVRYHARDVSLIRGQQEGAVVILGSATPSLESYQNSLLRKYTYLMLPERVDSRSLPKVEIVRLSKEGPRSLLSPPLLALLETKLALKEQALLFLNQRGFAPFLLCLECGDVPLCPECAISMTLHKRRGILLCHYCNASGAVPVRCVRCRGTRLKEMGSGTEKIEESLHSIFPEARILRMDRDTTQAKHAHHDILRSVSLGEVDILIGTQMIAKGHDLHRVTLVGILCSDMGLQLPDFRSMERTFQLLVQVSGRAGRGPVPGEVLIQTYNPDHYVVHHAKTHDVLAFYNQELAFRAQGPYPPFCRLIAVKLKGKQEQAVAEAAERIANQIRGYLSKEKGEELLGPAPCPIERIRGEYRWQILLRSNSNRSIGLTLNRVLPAHRRQGSVKIEVDVDPQHLL